MSLRELLSVHTPDIAAIEARLDSLSHDERVGEVRSLPGKAIRALYDAAEGRDIDVAFLVPGSIADATPVRHFGINSLLAFRTFEKRFARAPGGAPSAETDAGESDGGDGDGPRLWGYNHQPMRWLTGPGYFTVVDPDPGEQLAIDYHHAPDEAPVEGWPAPRRNERFPDRLVYGWMEDFMRRVSREVSVGRAWRHGKPENAWFALVRDASA